MILEKAVCTLGSITLQDKKINLTFDKHFFFVFFCFFLRILTGSNDTVL